MTEVWNKHEQERECSKHLLKGGKIRVVTDLDGNFLVQIGSTGEEGLQDGNFEEATFNRPQGLAYDAKRNLLYVADTENHALRVIDFVNEVVRTLAGNGTKGSDYRGGGKGTDQA
ncbi:unnamed protein product [Thlaspi arvense]|uniref:NHL repeat-containing protein n=1 Tax=Thlaspi arvense TaxID=13288 RepID=A0AAU9SMQ0_THLAR|nr:unnamed protein product [Thlaspi arvense]